MNLYTKKGDTGETSLAKLQKVPKSDDRIQLLGSIDELTCHLGMVKANEDRKEILFQIEKIQKNLTLIMAGIADQYNTEYRLPETEILSIEQEIDRLETAFPRKKEFVLPGGNRYSAQIDIARTVARRAERWLCIVDRKFNAEPAVKKYMNRLSDYLYILARYMDYVDEEAKKTSGEGEYREKESKGQNLETDDLIRVLARKLRDEMNPLTLEQATKIITELEKEADRRGVKAVIAVCNKEGNPIAVHVMDGAYLASFDIAMKKAYTSVALKMTTKRLGELSRQGEEFFGIDKADNGRLIIFGGGVPLIAGDVMIGGLGVSGGTAQEDAELAEFGAGLIVSKYVFGGVHGEGVKSKTKDLIS